jgi:Sec-independent protein translocase protein TatA
MFGIGLSEFAVIVCIVIVFVRPKDLPALFRRLGKLYAQAKRAYKEITEVKDQFVKSIEVAAAETEAGKGGASPSDASAPATDDPAGAGDVEPAAQELGGESLAGDELGESGYIDGSDPVGEVADPSREA